jgi:hypothetical protein
MSEKSLGDPNVRQKSFASPTTPKYPGVRVTCNGYQLMAEHVETRVTEGGVFYPITPSTEGGEIYQGAYAQGQLNVWGQQKVAVEAEGEHAAQGGATAYVVTGKRTVNFTPGQVSCMRGSSSTTRRENFAPWCWKSARALVWQQISLGGGRDLDPANSASRAQVE